MEQLQGYLKRLLEGSGAQAAVIWTRPGQSATGSVVCACPAEVLPEGTAWPEIGHTAPGVIAGDPAVVTSLVPTTLRLELSAAPTAAVSLPLAEPGLSLLLVWCGSRVPETLPEDLHQLIDQQIADHARIVHTERRAALDARRLEAVVASLEHGVASVDRDQGRAEVNPVAATLLGLPAGEVAASEFAAAMRDLESKALNRSEAASIGTALLAHADANLHCTLCFDQSPTHVRVSSHAFHRRGVSGRVWTFEDVSETAEALEAVEHARALLRASTDSMLDPQVVFEAVRDPVGRVVDFRYISANQATCSYLEVTEQELLGRSALDTLPNLEGSGLLARYAGCLQDGEPVVLTDFSYFNEILDHDRRYDIRATRTSPDLLTLSWEDVTKRFQAAQRIATSERAYRLLAENSSDLVTHVRNGRFAWVSPAAQEVFGAPAEYWVGRRVREIVPPEDASALATRLAILAEGGTVKERIRVVSVDGVTHWIDLHAKPFYDDGHQDGFTAALRLADDEVAAQQRADEALRQQARADALYRRSMDSAAVGMCLADLEGNFVEANDALCEFFGYDAQTLQRMTWQQLTDPDYLEADLDNRTQVLAGDIESYRMVKRFIHADGHPIWGDLSVSCIRDASGGVEMFIGQITDITAEVEATQQYKLLAENAGDLVVHVRDGRFAWVSPSCTDVIGGSPDYWVGREATEIVVPEEGELITESTEVVESGGVVQMRHRVQALDGTIHWVDVHAKPFLAPDGREDGITAAMRVIDDEVAAEEAAEKAREQQARSDALYRRLMDSSPIGMTISNPDGRYVAVNQAVCKIFGYSEAELLQMTWQDVTVEENIGPGSYLLREILAGRLDTFEFTGQQNRRDNLERWSKVGVSCLRAADGTVEHLIGQIVDVTAETLAQRELTEQSERNRVLAQSLQQTTDRITSELDSAATYMASIMPRGLHGPVEVSSRYLPSRELGGDCFDYHWIDDDHLLVYLIDVSGHGLEPALLSVSLHNMLRSGSFTTQTLLAPEAVLTELNRLFQMEQQRDHYFTAWYGVYQASTRTLRYANAGSPPPFAFSSDDDGTVSVTKLSVASTPIGMFEDSEFTAHTYPVPAGCQILVYSDGASEISLADDHQLKPTDFNQLIARVASSPDWSLDGLIDELRALTPSEAFEDDLSLIHVRFD
jgi:PAS domain S-box-containing protein